MRALLLLALLAGCGSAPPAPDWEANAAQAMQAYQRLYLAGDTAAAEAEFRRAKGELGRTGKPGLLARAELFRCAVRTASLELDGCPGFEALRGEASREDIAYKAYLDGKGQHAASAEPLSRLVAAAVALQKGSLDPARIDDAVETASGQGWRRPLLAWLSVQLKRAVAAGEREAAARIRRRMALVSG